MRVTRLVFREIAYRKLNFALGVLSVLIAVGCVVAAVSMLGGFDAATENLLQAKEQDTTARMAKLEDDVRKMSVDMGFNMVILPKDQNLGDLYADEYASKYMPESYADQLVKSHVATINHVLPSLTQKLQWQEAERTVIVSGVRGEYMQSKKQKPILEPVPPGTVAVGYELQRSQKLAVGQKLTLNGHDFTVGRIEPKRGNKDDITLWINLHEAQELLQKPAQINAILALECNCSKNRLSQIREEVTAVLPDTQVDEFASQALMRAEARTRAATESQASLAAEKEGRQKLRDEKEGLAALAIPVIIGGCALWIALLTWGNVRERSIEIGLLRAIGWRSYQVLSIFLVRAALMGLIGAGLGYIAGWSTTALWSRFAAGSSSAWPTSGIVQPALMGAVLSTAPLVAVLAGWLPALVAAQRDPATILCEE